MTPEEMAAKLLATHFERSEPGAGVLTDPVADTPMVVTLDQLRPYDNDPRVTRNPAFEEIKVSIRQRGLDAPPAITRRPGEAHYIIRNGGNTRLAILRELWAESKEERFFRIQCLFRPWPPRGEIVVLTGHLAENELRGGLSFIERALGVQKVQELYEQESPNPLSQSELARRLAADGFPVQQSHISRMQDAVRYLLPAIPTLLYAGLGRHQVERLAVLRRACERIWERRSVGRDLPVDFATLFQESLVQFDTGLDAFSAQRVQDELVGQMADLLDADYDTLCLEIDDSESRQRALTSAPVPAVPAESRTPDARAIPAVLPTAAQSADSPIHGLAVPSVPAASPPVVAASRDVSPSAQVPGAATPQQHDSLRSHIVSPASTTDRLASIQRLVADNLCDAAAQVTHDGLQSIPVQVDGLYPINDVWHIEPSLDAPASLRTHIAQFAREIAAEAALAEQVESTDHGIGFVCAAPEESSAQPPTDFARTVLVLLRAVSGDRALSAEEGDRLGKALGPLLRGQDLASRRLCDAGLVKLFRMLRLARRLVDIEAASASGESPAQ